LVTTKQSTAAAADLRLVLAAATLEVVATEISDGDQTTQVADVDTVWITDLEQSFPQELCRTVSYLTVTFHLTKTQATIPEHIHTQLLHLLFQIANIIRGAIKKFCNSVRYTTDTGKTIVLFFYVITFT